MVSDCFKSFSHSELNSGGIIKLVVSCVHIFISFKTKSFLNYILYTVIHHLIIFLEACHPGFFHGGFSTEINQPILNLSMWFLYWWQCVCFYQVYSKGFSFNFLRVSLPTHQTQTHWNGQRDRLTGGRITRQAERQKEIGKERLTDKSRLDCRIDGYYMTTIFRTIISAFTHIHNVDCKFKKQQHNMHRKSYQ